VARPTECSAAGAELVEDRADCKDVGTRVGRLAPSGFRRHVPDGAVNRPRLVEIRTEIGRQLGQTEVQDLERSVVGNDEILRLEVPVKDAARVGGGESASKIDRQPE
jgi:hypothetical protein